MGGHATHVVGRRRSRTVGSAYAGVILRAAPGETNTRIANRVALHLVDGHFCGVTVNELDKAAALARGNLDVGDFSKALKEGPELILSDVTRQATNKHSGIVWVRELVHRLDRVVLLPIIRVVTPHGRSRRMAGNRGHHRGGRVMTILVMMRALLRGGRRDAHGAIATINSLHLYKSALHIGLVTEANEAIAAGLACHSVRHNLGGFARRKTRLKQGDQDEFVDLGAEIADKDAVFRTAIVAGASLA